MSYDSFDDEDDESNSDGLDDDRFGTARKRVSRRKRLVAGGPGSIVDDEHLTLLREVFELMDFDTEAGMARGLEAHEVVHSGRRRRGGRESAVPPGGWGVEFGRRRRGGRESAVPPGGCQFTSSGPVIGRVAVFAKRAPPPPGGACDLCV